MSRLFYCLLAIITFYCISKVNDSHGLFLAAMVVILSVRLVYIEQDRTDYIREFRKAKSLLQKFRDTYEKD